MDAALLSSSTWFYIDNGGQERGPFGAADMVIWYRLGYFPAQLLVRRNIHSNFITLSSLALANVVEPIDNVHPVIKPQEMNEAKLSETSRTENEYIECEIKEESFKLEIKEECIKPEIKVECSKFEIKEEFIKTKIEKEYVKPEIECAKFKIKKEKSKSAETRGTETGEEYIESEISKEFLKLESREECTKTKIKEEVETLEPPPVQEGSKKRSAEDESSGAGYNAAKYFNKKQKVVKIPIQNNSNYSEAKDVEEPVSSEKYRHVGRHFDNTQEQDEDEEEAAGIPACLDVESEEEEETPVCLDVEPTSLKYNPHTNDNPDINKEMESANDDTEILDDSGTKHDENEALDDEDPSEYLCNSARKDLEQLNEFRVWENEAMDDSDDEDEDTSEYLRDPARKDLEQLNEFREWEKTGFESGDVKLRILSYSVLSQAMLDARPQLARGKSKTWLEWEYRWWGIMREVLTLEPDIVCLQEIQMKKPNHFQIFLLPFFNRHGYESAFKCKTGDNVDGCAIFFKSYKFSLENEVGVDYYRTDVDILGKINVGLICRLVPLTGTRCCSTRLVVSTTQLHHNKARTDVRLGQAAVLLAELDRQALKPNGQYHPTVMAGNFNLLPFSTVYQLITGGNLAYEGLILGEKVMSRELVPEEVGLTGDCRWQEVLVGRVQPVVKTPGRLSHGFGFRSVYKHKRVKAAARPKTNKHPGENEVSVFVDGDLPHMDKLLNLDYMFYTVPSYYAGQDAKMEGPLKLIARLTLPTEEEMISLGGMPSRICPSSHLPLAADFILKTF